MPASGDDPLADTRAAARPLSTARSGQTASLPRDGRPTFSPALERSRMQLLQQQLGAERNASAFGSAPSGGAATVNP